MGQAPGGAREPAREPAEPCGAPPGPRHREVWGNRPGESARTAPGSGTRRKSGRPLVLAPLFPLEASGEFTRGTGSPRVLMLKACGSGVRGLLSRMHLSAQIAF